MKVLKTMPVKRIIIGNWKMNPKTVKEAITLFKLLLKSVPEKSNITYVLLVPVPYYIVLVSIKQKKIILGIQNIHQELSGAYTGEISFSMFDKHPAYILVGHSERRQLGETDEDINKKILHIIKTKSKIILCVGEKSRDHGVLFLATIRSQIERALAGVAKRQIENIIIAYEPVWAIGSGALRSATPEEVREVVIYIKKVLFDLYGDSGRSINIIYGGSVDEQNAVLFLRDGGVDGFLPGRISLDAKKFRELIRVCM